MFYVMQMIRQFPKNEKGQALTEYGLIIALVAIVLIAGLGLLTGGLQAIFQSISDTLTGAA